MEGCEPGWIDAEGVCFDSTCCVPECEHHGGTCMEGCETGTVPSSFGGCFDSACCVPEQTVTCGEAGRDMRSAMRRRRPRRRRYRLHAQSMLHRGRADTVGDCGQFGGVCMESGCTSGYDALAGAWDPARRMKESAVSTAGCLRDTPTTSIGRVRRTRTACSPTTSDAAVTARCLPPYPINQAGAEAQGAHCARVRCMQVICDIECTPVPHPTGVACVEGICTASSNSSPLP